MDRELLTWATVSTLASPAIKDQQFLANLIESHKNGTAVPPTTPPRIQETNKRPKIHVTPVKEKPVAFPDYANTPAKRVLYTEMMGLPDPIDAQAQTAVATNNIIGNKFRSAEWANIHLATTREENWICTRGTGISSYYCNPRKAVHTLFNWHKIAVSDSDLNNIEFIDSLKQPMLLAASVQKAFLAQGITLTRGYKEFADVFACTELEIHPILIVAVAKVHETY